MNAQDIRTLNERMQEQMLNAQTVGEQEAGFKSLLLSLLSELAAQQAEANRKWDMILYPPLMVEYNKSKIDPADWLDLPQPVHFTMTEPRATLRDQFAMAAMQGLFSASADEFWIDLLRKQNTTAQAYMWADKMMEERNGKAT
jgi:exonuclease III